MDESVEVLVPLAMPVQPLVFTHEKFIKNGARVSKGTIKHEKGRAWTLNMLKIFRAREAIQRTNFVGRQFDIIT